MNFNKPIMDFSNSIANFSNLIAKFSDSLMDFTHEHRMFRSGRAGLELYTEIHQNNTNQIIHGLGMPFVGYAIFGLANFFCASPLASLLIYFSYFIYYLTFDVPGAMFSLVIYYPVLMQSISDWLDLDFYYGQDYVPTTELLPASNYLIYAEQRRKYCVFYIQLFCLSVFIQEGLGHFFYEVINSDLYQLPNSMSQAPLFGTRALMHNWLNYSLLPSEYPALK